MSCSPYHPFHTFIFDGQTNHPVNPQPKHATIQDMYSYRPTFTSDGNVFQLYKSDLQYNKNGSLKIVNPKVCGKTGFVIFSFHTYNIGWSQDTKSMFSAVAIVDDGQTGKNLFSAGADALCTQTIGLLNTCKTPMIMFLNADGGLSEFKGPINVDALRGHINNTRYI